MNATTYIQLQTVIDFEGLQDILEMHEVHNSWKHAEALNAAWRAKIT